MCKKKKKFKLNQKGQGLVEYLILVSLMAVASLAIMRTMGQTVQAKFARVTKELQGSQSRVKIRAVQVKESDFKRKDMSDFFHGASAQ